MRHRNIVFHRLTKHIPWSAFDRAVSTHGSDRRVRRLRTRDQFLALLYGQFSGAASLRDAVRLLDATKVNLSALSEGWARFSEDHCAAKVHVVYEPHGGVPLRAVVTPDNVNDITPARAMPIEPGVTYVFDLAYYSYEWWAELHALRCRFVSRLKKNTTLAVTTERPVPAGTDILSDRIGHLPKRIGGGRNNPFTGPVREIAIGVDRNKTLRFVTNDLEAPAEEIAALYKQRWEIELFFKWIKRNLKIKHFLGVSENAVKIQIYVALIAFLILRTAHNAQKTIPKPQAFARLMRLNIMHRRSLLNIKDTPQIPPPDTRQINLQLAPC